jgi:filamentous hemagglutinin family protein
MLGSTNSIKLILALVSVGIVLPVGASNLPSGSQIISGQVSINREATNRLVVNQSTSSATINWQQFSIGSGSSVVFNQPSTSSVALNRVVGSDPSIIQGSLIANGQVFLVNPNGVIFGRDSRVDVGGLIATTLNITNENFQSGNYVFSSGVTLNSNAVVNQGNIKVAEGGSASLVAARVINDGLIDAPKGQIALAAADEILLDLGGPVKLQITRGTFDAQVSNGGIIRSTDGLVFIKASAFNDLSRSVINQTGVIEAQSLNTDQAGQIILLASGRNSELNVSGKLDASASIGSRNGGFIETSATKVNLSPGLVVTTRSARGQTGEWLIDPTNIIISSGISGTISSNSSSDTVIGATTIENHLVSNNLTIETASAGSDAGNITVNAPISWSANRLTLKAHNNIGINANLNATGTASLAFEFGLDGLGASTFTFASGVTAWIPNASSFTWKEGSGSVNSLYINSGALRFGGGSQISINSAGNLLQPWYKNAAGTWNKLTYSSYPLNLSLAEGGDGSGANPWNLNGTIVDVTSSISQRINIAGYKVGGASTADAGKAWGRLISETEVLVGSKTVLITNDYNIDKNSSYMRTLTTLTNPSSAISDLTNLRLWVGTQDDYVGTSDIPTKEKGNFTAIVGTSDYEFTQITNKTDQGKALKVFTGNETVFFYSTSSEANSSISGCCSFSNAYGVDPFQSVTSITNDGSYAMFSKFSNLTPGSSNSLTWFYAAGAVTDLASVINQVATAAVVAEVQQAAADNPAPTPIPTPTATPTVSQQAVAAIESIQSFVGGNSSNNSLIPSSSGGVNAINLNSSSDAIRGAARVNLPTRQALQVMPNPGSMESVSSQVPNMSGGLTFTRVPVENDLSATSSAPTTASSTQASTANSGSDAFGFMRVFVVGGGISLSNNPAQVGQQGSNTSTDKTSPTAP